jgi:hypothetical protein
MAAKEVCASGAWDLGGEVALRTMIESWEAFCRESRKGKGLVGASAAGVYLGVSRQRVVQLMEDGRLTEFVFLGMRWVAVRELEERVQMLGGARSGVRVPGKEKGACVVYR